MKNFNKLGKMQRRVAIAKDVIKQLKAHKTKATLGTYLRGYIDDRKNIECHACAAGALLLAKLGFVNKINVIYRPETAYKVNLQASKSTCSIYLGDEFSDDELGKLECAFECWWMTGNEKQIDRWQNNSAKNRLLKLMRSIVKHKGRLGLSKMKELKGVTFHNPKF